MKVVYLTWGETPRTHGVFGSQVLEQYTKIKHHFNKCDFHFISAVPIIHSGLVREKFSYLNEIKKVKNILNDISFSIIPIYASQNIVNSSKLLFNLLHIGSNWHLKNKLTRINPDIVHCRSYHAAYAALKVRDKYELNYKVIFDGRGLWPEEVSLKNCYSSSNKNYLFLKKIELKLLQESDAVVAVSDTMKQHYQNILRRDIECIYLSSDVTNDMGKVNTRKSETIFCYIGAISKTSGWHLTTALVEIYLKASTLVTNPKILIITTSPHKELRKNLSSIPSNQLLIKSTKTKGELNGLLKDVSFGLLPFRKNLTTDAERKIGATMLATKTAEYLAAGIPILCNMYCGGAGEIVNKFEVGINYDPNKVDELTKKDLDSLAEENISIKCKRVALENFDYEVNARKYMRLYESLLD